MIISASRRTDMPSYFSDWFYNRIKAGFVMVRNPMNFHQISKIDLAPDVVDGIVFWTKNPLPMLGRLGELRDYMYYGVKSNIKELALLDFPPAAQVELSSHLAGIARSYGMAIDTCAERLYLQKYGIEHARCIDDRLLAKLLGCRLNVSRDKAQRLGCGCAASVDIGMYNT